MDPHRRPDRPVPRSLVAIPVLDGRGTQGLDRRPVPGSANPGAGWNGNRDGTLEGTGPLCRVHRVLGPRHHRRLFAGAIQDSVAGAEFDSAAWHYGRLWPGEMVPNWTAEAASLRAHVDSGRWLLRISG